MPQWYAPKLIAMTMLALVLLATGRSFGVRDGRAGLAVLMLLVASVLLVALHTGDPDLGPYLTVPLHLTVGFLACYILEPRFFRDAYINVMAASALISVALYLVARIAPSVISFFPLRMSTESYDYYDAGVHVFLVSRAVGEQGIPLDRNSGFAWEPGAYQVFLNLAILLLVQRRAQTVERRKDRIVALALVAGVVTTLSTGGYLTMAVILSAYSREVFAIFGMTRHLIRYAVGPVAIVAAGLLFAARDVDATFIGEKFTREFSNGSVLALERIGLDRVGFVASDFQSIFGVGFTAWLDTELSLWNSVIHSAVTLGLPFTLGLGALYVRYCRQYRHPVAALALMTVAFSTEALFWRMLFAYLAFSGVMYASSHLQSRTQATESSPASPPRGTQK
ncbi:hypothetical protein SAMN05192576_2199 [Nocardioides szechwanensis]|uniref:O-Antigen ligase n=2 Tax=Nocardioides szechwanensis TaxID=1005944 RepID=A0A1H0BQ50_9ACTN|nr:hypothetical protein SAMN05192576_2199 [Nocardioides szechwanensis]